MAATDTPPNLTNNPALVRALIALLLSQPSRTTIPIEAAGQEFTRAACRKAVAQALREYTTTNASLVDRHPDLADFTKYADEQAFLEDAWRAVNEFIVSQQPEGNLPTRQQLEYWMDQMELDRLERLATNPDKANPWTAENLTLEQMKQLWEAARRWDEARLGIQQGAMNAITNDLSPETQALAIPSQDLQAIADTLAQAATQQAAADVQTGARLDPTAAQRIAGIINHSSRPASAAATIATATASGRSTFRQGVTETLTQAPASQEAYQFTQRVKEVANVDDRQAVVIRNAFEDAVEQGRDQQTALRESLRTSGFSPREADRIAAANRTVAQDYHQFVNDVGNTTQQWKRAVHARQTFARAAAPSAQQLVRNIQAATGVSSEKAQQAWVVFEDNIRHGPQVALERSLAELRLPSAQLRTAQAALTPAVTTYEALVQQGQAQVAARQFADQIQVVTGVSQEKALEALATIEHEVAQNQPHQTALAESLAQLNLEPEQTQAAYNHLAAAVEDYVQVSQDLQTQPLSVEAAQPVAQRFAQQIQAATGITPEQAAEIRDQFEASLAQGKTPDKALYQSLQTLSLPPEQHQAAIRQLTGSAQLYQRFAQQGKTQTPTALAPPEAQEQFVQHLAGSTNVSRSQAIQISQHFEQAIRLGHPPQAALTNSLSRLGLPPEQLEQLSNSLAPVAREYADLVRIAPLNQAGLGPSPSATVPLTTLVNLNKQSLSKGGPIISRSALELHQMGVRGDTLARALAESRHHIDFNPEFLEQTQTALTWLEQHPELMQELGLETPSAPLKNYILEMDARPWNSDKYFQRRFEQLNLQLAAKNAQGATGWLKAPKLKWQARWTKFVADHPHMAGVVGFVSSPKAFVKHKVGGWLVGKGMRWLSKSAAGKAVGKLATKIGAKLAEKGLAKLVGGAVGTLIGGPVGTAVGLAIGFVLEKVGNWVARNWKKLAKVLGALFALLAGLIAKLAATLPALLTGLGIWLAPTIPIIGVPMLIAGLSGLAFQVGSWIGKGGIVNAANSIISGIGSFLGLSTTATVPAYIVAAPFVAVAGLAALNVFSTIALTTAFVLPPTEAQAPGLTQDPGNVVEFSCDHPACKIADIVQAYAGGVLTQNTWTVAVDNLLRDNFSEATVSELERSVNSFYYLQCVGFKVAAEKELGVDLPHQNAVAFMYSHPGCSEVSKDQAQYGDNAVWGPQDGCSTTDPQEANSLCSSNSACCGHIGVVTKTKGNQKVFVTSANASGNGSVDTREFTRYNVDKFIRCQ